jgi:hypothetical protein
LEATQIPTTTVASLVDLSYYRELLAQVEVLYFVRISCFVILVIIIVWCTRDARRRKSFVYANLVTSKGNFALKLATLPSADRIYTIKCGNTKIQLKD